MSEQSIFIAALDIDDAVRRAEFLDQACGDNATLRKRVNALLEEHERSGEFLNVPALEQIQEAGAVTRAMGDEETHPDAQDEKSEMSFGFLQPTDVPGSLGRLGQYDIQEMIGRGGCGIVFKAFDERLHRVVAIKVMTPEMAATSPARKRFLREARATAAIRHDNVVHIYSVEESPIPFLVMEYIAGKTLQQWIDETGPLDLTQILQFGQMIANGLEAAHQKRLIHRDIKPANLLIESGTGQIKITDFGLARAADDASVSQSGCIVGTPLYMSPEQAQGRNLDHRSDLFSLGSVLYVMCSGRLPFRAELPYAVLRRIVDEEPRHIQEIIPEVPDWLVAIIGKLHAKAPAQRYASAQEVADLLAHPPSVMASRTNSAADHASIFSRIIQGNHFWLKAAAIFFVLLSSLGFTEATGITDLRGTVVRFFSPTGTVLVEVDDPAVGIAIDDDQLVITGAGAKAIRLKPGQHRVTESKDGEPLFEERVTISRDGQQVVRVSQGEAKSAEGFDPLFNETNLDGWIPKRSAFIEWRNDNGTITGLNRSAHFNSAGMLQSIKQYRDFHFRCDVLAGSGVEPFLLFRNEDILIPGQRRGYALIEPVPSSPIIVEGWGYGSLYADDFQVIPQKSRLVPSRNRDLGIRAGDWYHLEFIANQQNIEVRINGISTASYTSTDPRLNKEGSLCIRCGAGGTVTLRKLEVREIATKEKTLPSPAP